VRGQRQYEFAVEVTAGPPNSVFRHTKVITVKSKYIVENQTGMPIEIKQRGTPDLDVLQYGSTAHGRCARRLEVNERCDLMLGLLLTTSWLGVSLPAEWFC